MLIRTNAVFRIVGVSFHRETVATLVEGQRLRLVCDEANPHDEYAIRVETLAGEMLGHVPADLARRIRTSDTSGEFRARVAALRTFEDMTVGADISLDRGEELAVPA
jgi:hypothetical protein